MGMTMLDIGCRGGPRPEWAALNAHIIGFDPDAAECERLKPLFPNVTFVPLALSDKPGRYKLHLMHDPGSSSFYDSIPGWYERGAGWWSKIGETEAEATTLDIWMSENWNVGRPEFIKLDTQGYELPILRGAQETLKGAILVMSEVEFNPIYEGQPLFGDVDDFLRSQGFELLALQDLNFVQGQLIWSDAYWFRPEQAGRAKEIARCCGIAC